MAATGKNTKIGTLLLLVSLFTAFTAAAQIQTEGGNQIVWKNSQTQPQLTAKCTAENATVSAFGTSDFEFDYEAGVSRVDVSSEEIPDNSLWRSNAEVNLVCKRNESVTDNVSKEISFSELEFNPNTGVGKIRYGNGVGFVGSVMKDEKGSLGNREGVLLGVDSPGGLSEPDLEDSLESSSFSFGSSGPLQESDESFEVLDSVTGLEGFDRGVALYPFVESYAEQDETFTVDFQGSGRLSGLEKSVPFGGFDPFVHVWSSDVVNDPGRRMGFDKVRKGGFVYDLFMRYAPNDNFPESEIDDDNFVLTVKEKGDDWDSGYQEVDDGKYAEMAILETSDPDSSNANYRVRIPEVGNTPLEDLPDDESPYKFVLKYRYESEGDTYSFVVDEMLVDKAENPSRFSGQILDSGGNGVKADMTLSPVNNDDSYLVSAGSDGQFSKDLSTSLSTRFDMDMDFFQSGDRVTEISLSGVDLEDANLGSQDISAINFDYWSDPQSVSGLDVEGLKPVNMMAIRFGYDIESVDSVSMDFDSSQLDPQDLKVYECDAWNFWGKRCEGDWEKIADNSNSSVVSYPEFWATFDEVNRYETSGNGEILRNAYVVGRSAKLQLQQSIALESSQVKHNGQLKASGVLVDENGNRVDDADVELSLVDASEDDVVQSWDAVTDATGSFTFEEKVTAGQGNYLLELTASKTPYRRLDVRSDETVSVYYETGIMVDAPTSPEIDQGETSEITFDVSNTGQQKVEDIQLTVSGVRNSYYTVSPTEISSIESGESRTVSLQLDLPGDYCSYPCSTSPEFNVKVNGVSGGEEVSSSVLIPTTLRVERNTQEQSSGNETSRAERNTTEVENDDDTTGAFSRVENITGDFVQKQSELNVALALIMIFTMVLAAAVKKRNEDSGSRRVDDRSRQISRPPVASSKEEGKEEVSEEVDETAENDGVEKEDEESEEESDSDEVPDNVCEVCGEEFKNAAGVKIHRKAVHES